MLRRMAGCCWCLLSNEFSLGWWWLPTYSRRGWQFPQRQDLLPCLFPLLPQLPHQWQLPSPLFSAPELWCPNDILDTCYYSLLSPIFLLSSVLRFPPFRILFSPNLSKQEKKRFRFPLLSPLLPPPVRKKNRTGAKTPVLRRKGRREEENRLWWRRK